MGDIESKHFYVILPKTAVRFGSNDLSIAL